MSNEKKWILISLPEEFGYDPESLVASVAEYFKREHSDIEVNMEALTDQQLISLSENVGDDMPTSEDEDEDGDEEADDTAFQLPG